MLSKINTNKIKYNIIDQNYGLLSSMEISNKKELEKDYELYFIVNDDKIVTSTNNNAGINGGISNGMPITFKVVVKPTPSIYQEQKTVNVRTNEETKIKIVGRHDPCIVRRVNIVIRCMTALVIADMLINRYGEEVFLKENL